jgi:hypothetical protein
MSVVCTNNSGVAVTRVAGAAVTAAAGWAVMAAKAGGGGLGDLRHLEYDALLLRKGIVAALSHMFAKIKAPRCHVFREDSAFKGKNKQSKVKSRIRTTFERS